MLRSITWTVDKSPASITECVNNVEKALIDCRVRKSTAVQFSLYLEELLVYMTDGKFNTEDTLTVKLCKRVDDVSIRIVLRGEEIPLPEFNGGEIRSADLLGIAEGDMEAGIRERILASGAERIHFSYKNHVNRCLIEVRRTQYEMLIKVLTAMLLGLACGFAMKFLAPEAVQKYINSNIFGTVVSMFMKAIKAMIGPLVFCSVAYCISAYSDASFLQAVGKHTVFRYFVNSLIGIAVAVGLCAVLKPGLVETAFDRSLLANSEITVDTSAASTDLWETVRNIVPSNVFAAFHNSAILQIIFLAVLFGIALGKTGVKGEHIRENIGALGDVFNKMTNLIMLILPAAIFCSMAKMACRIGLETVLYLLGWLGLLFAAYIILMAIYVLIVLWKTGTHPGDFISRTISCVLIAFSIGSGSASMSTTLSTCREKLGVKPEVCNFTVPLGVSIHSASSCVFYIISVVFLGNLYTGTNVLNSCGAVFFVSVFLLAFGAPSVSGAGPICVAVLLTYIDVPMECIALILAWDPIVSTIKTACSCMEDLSVAYLLDHKLRKGAK